MPNTSYSVLFMRDDADVKTLRVSPRRLKLLLWISICLAMLVTIGLAVGMRSYVGYHILLKERRDLEVRLADSQVNLERLGNLEKIQKGASAPAKEGKTKTAEPATGRANRAFHKVDSGAMTVENFRAQMQGGNVAVAFDLNNRAQGAASGDIALLLLRNDGTLTELDAASASDLTYQISRFKRISASARAPQGVSRKEALGLRVEIKNSSGEVILGETYALGN